MIAKRIRRGVRRARGSVRQTTASVIALSRYLIDADPRRLLQLARIEATARYLLRSGGDHAWNEALAEAGVEAGEKVGAFGTRNLVGTTLEQWQAEMVAIAARCPRARNPLEHYVLSWPSGEVPTDAQAGETVEIFLGALGTSRLPAIWAVHENTEHRHIHIMLLRVDPQTGRAVQPGDGWDLDRMQQAVALIEERQGWKAEPGALFVAREGALYHRKTGALVRTADGEQVSRARRTKRETDVDPAMRAAILEAARAARDWPDFHARLRAHDIHYRKAGSGARLLIGEVEHKASAIDASLARKQLEAGLGPFKPAVDAASKGSYEAYRQAASAELARIRSAHQDARARLREACNHAVSEIGGGPHADVLRAAIRLEYGAAGEALDAAFHTAKISFAATRLSLADWHAGACPAAPAPAALPMLILPGSPSLQERPIPAGSVAIGGFAARSGRWQTDYIDAVGRVAITDHRSVLIVHRTDMVSVAVALCIAAERWQAVTASGSPEFLRLAAIVAAKYGLDVTDDTGARLPKPVAEAPRLPQKEKVPLPRSPVQPSTPVPAPVPVHEPEGLQTPIPDPAAAAQDDDAWLEYLQQMQDQRRGRGR